MRKWKWIKRWNAIVRCGSYGNLFLGKKKIKHEPNRQWDIKQILCKRRPTPEK